MQRIIHVLACWCWVTLIHAQPNITRVEYFLNTDPGFGNGTNIPITPAANLTDINFNANIGSVPEGLNSLFMRSRDANGKWSVSNRFLFVKIGGVVSPNISAAEYFINTDPGFGNGIAIPVSAAPDIVNLNASINLSTADLGINSLYLRSRDQNGRWSVSNRFLFVKMGNVPNANITTAEYFFDNDPGFGNGIPITITPGLEIADVSLNANMAPLSLGLHSLYLRTKDANGKWSVSNRFIFVKAANQIGVPNITSTEYFIDTDPGFGNGVPVALNPSGNLPDFIMNVNISGLAVGDHNLYLRSKDVTGKWSITNIYKFPIGTLAAAPVIAVNSINKKTMCGDTRFDVAYHATGTYNAGNAFTVQLSNAAGSFAAPTNIGSITATTSGLIPCTIPLQIANGAAYRVRVVSSNPVVTGLTSDTIFTLYTQPRYNDTAVFIVCQNETVNLVNVYNTSGFTSLWNTANPTVAPAATYQHISSNTALCKDTSIVIVKQDVATWTGAVSKDWHTPGNWSTGMIPFAKTHVIIPNGVINTCELTLSNVSVASIQVKPGGKIDFKNGRTVDVTAKCNPLPQ